MMSLESLYQELILDHSKRPKGKGLAEATGRSALSHQRNPICGDEVTLQVRLNDDGNAIRDITWDGAGCSISQASASMLVALVDEEREISGEAMSVADARALVEKFREALRSRGSIPLDEETFGDAAALSGVSKYTARVKCAMLAWVALEDTLARA
ncbi:Fe-S cluster assembly sulfur transfer protein SufU [Microbacterium aquimaris]|uniref:SUF system NifU family Fe-S cluster assembly protein n=1 Tax=Microbacterium aquimaris TaxID=459816 RepID=A0ABU5N3X2_9MICO|nr:SUF system NifU family Fe-S cluster assembly protein [Microbacterium aquimaris]MDZ8160617.1 SUF system NifU family Fe-S cluster assembly protein [Microbacterium aquimaris]